MSRFPSTLLPLAALLLAACGRGERAALPAAAPAPADAIGVRAVSPREGTEALTRVTGELRARHEATLSAEASGRVQRIAVDVGDRVRKGDVLVELDASAARISVAQARAARAMAQAALKNARNERARTEELARGEAASPAMLDRASVALEQAEAAAEQAEAAVLAAEDHLRKHALRAPFDGVVTARTKSPGEYVAMMPPTPILALVDVATVEVRASVPEAVVDLLSPGAELAATVSPSGKPFKAKIRAMGASVEPGTRTVDVRADVVGPVFRELRPGALVELALGDGASASGLFLPAGTVREGERGPFVWTVVDEKLARQPVSVERLGPGLVRVSGISKDALVVSEAASGLADGAAVKVLR
jgi:RND family efflux transporter MFP subunit